MIKKKKPQIEEHSPAIKVKTKVYRTIPTTKNIEETNAPKITTARRSNIEVTLSCNECGDQIKKNDMKKCPGCGYDFCSQCLQEHDCDDYTDENYDD